jgi:hypothetical protein
MQTSADIRKEIGRIEKDWAADCRDGGPGGKDVFRLCQIIRNLLESKKKKSSSKK